MAVTYLVHLTRALLYRYHSTPTRTTATDPREALDTWRENSQRNLVRCRDHLQTSVIFTTPTPPSFFEVTG